MTRSTGKRRPHFKNVIPTDPAVKPIHEWVDGNRYFYSHFRRWLKEGGYGESSLHIYGVAARLAFGYLNRPYWKLAPEKDLDIVREYITGRYPSAATREAYFKGLAKLAEFIRLHCHKPAPEKQVNWPYYLDTLPPWLVEHVRAYIAHRQRSWSSDRLYKSTQRTLSQLTGCLRWVAAHAKPNRIEDITPDCWYDFLAMRLESGISPVTSNHDLRALQAFLLFLEDLGHPICRRVLLLEPLNEGNHLARDAPVEKLRILFAEIQAEAASPHACKQSMGVMDRAWFLVMLHGGLRAGEVRRLKASDIDWDRRQMRIEQSKGLKDRIVFLSRAAAEALQAYLAVRRPSSDLPEQVFVYHHLPLSANYFNVRLRTYGRRCGVQITPHQLRHSCATLLLNAGAPVLTLQAILGHKHIDTTLRYARLYDGTLATDYYQAMGLVESYLALEECAAVAPQAGDLLPLLDVFDKDMLDEAQNAALQALRTGLIALVKQEVCLNMENVKVLAE